jgi:hypothetical protein
MFVMQTEGQSVANSDESCLFVMRRRCRRLQCRLTRSIEATYVSRLNALLCCPSFDNLLVNSYSPLIVHFNAIRKDGLVQVLISPVDGDPASERSGDRNPQQRRKGRQIYLQLTESIGLDRGIKGNQQLAPNTRSRD